MKKLISAIISIMMIAQLFTAMPISVSAEGIGEDYTSPEPYVQTYNMNLDWKFFEPANSMTQSLQTTIASAAKDGKQFYDVDYDDSSWETVSIPHAVNGKDAFRAHTVNAGGGAGRQGVFLYRKTFTIPEAAAGGKVFFELEGIRQAAYVWINGEPLGYYEAGITAMGFDLTNYVEAGKTAVIAVCNDCAQPSGNPNRTQYETVPGEEWGSSYTLDNGKNRVGSGASYEWSPRDFNETQAGMVYDAYLHVKPSVYQTLPLYNNLKTTGNYIYASDFDIRSKKATINVNAEIRNESAAAGDYSLEVAVVDAEGKLAFDFESDKVNVAAATDKGVVYETAVESNVYSAENIETPTGITEVNTPDVTYISASYAAEGVNFWSLDNPYLYTVYTILKDSDGKVIDVEKKETGFRKVTYDRTNGLMINDKNVWLTGYAQRSTNEWAVIGIATDWLQDYDMALLKENNSNFIRWMHVAPKPAEVRSSDRYGVAIACPAGDKEGDANGRQWSQRAEAMRDTMIYFRNNPSVIFWETGNSPIAVSHVEDMVKLRDELDPYGMRFLGARSTTSSSQLNYPYNYAGTMYGGDDNCAKGLSAINAMSTNGIFGPIMETEYERGESPRRVWDDYSPPDYDYVNKYLNGRGKTDGYDMWDMTQEDIVLTNVRGYNKYYANRVGAGLNVFSAEAMMVWSDSNMHGRNSGSENCRTSGRVDPVRQKKEMFEGTRAAHATEATVHIVGHWSYPEVSADTYNYYDKEDNGTYCVYDLTKPLKRDPTTKTVYAIGSVGISKIELYRVDGETETLIGTDEESESNFIYQFDKVDVTKGDAVIAKAYDARGTLVATDKIERTYDAVTLKLTPHTAPGGWRADGSDIAYIDVEVIDKNGNTCALNYDKISFTYSGDGEYLGGYNSGSGAGCFQNSAASAGLSNYFGGAKDEISTIRQDYVYAENGTNRIFVKSTRNAGTFTLNAAMDGQLPVPVTITSVAVDNENGLSTLMQSTLDPGLSTEVPISSNVPAMRPLMDNKKLIAWSGVTVVKNVSETTEYYDTYFNGTKLELSPQTRMGTMNTLFGPIYTILTTLKEMGVTGYEVSFDDSEPQTMTLTKDGSVYKYIVGVNQMSKDDNANYSETADAAYMESDVMIANIPLMMDLIGVKMTIDNENHILYLTDAQ